MNEISEPSLVEPNVKNYLKKMLHNIHIFKVGYYTFIFNVFLFASFFLLLGLILLFKYKGKPSKEELEERKKQKEQFIFSRLKNYQDNKVAEHQKLITCLPKW
jgi:hypothetical protein